MAAEKNALRHLSAVADTLSPQEVINVCADALGVDRHPYSGNVSDGNRSAVEYERALATKRAEASRLADFIRDLRIHATALIRHDAAADRREGCDACLEREQLEDLLEELALEFGEVHNSGFDS